MGPGGGAGTRCANAPWLGPWRPAFLRLRVQVRALPQASTHGSPSRGPTVPRAHPSRQRHRRITGSDGGRGRGGGRRADPPLPPEAEGAADTPAPGSAQPGAQPRAAGGEAEGHSASGLTANDLIAELNTPAYPSLEAAQRALHDEEPEVEVEAEATSAAGAESEAELLAPSAAASAAAEAQLQAAEGAAAEAGPTGRGGAAVGGAGSNASVAEAPLADVTAESAPSPAGSRLSPDERAAAARGAEALAAAPGSGSGAVPAADASADVDAGASACPTGPEAAAGAGRPNGPAEVAAEEQAGPQLSSPGQEQQEEGRQQPHGGVQEQQQQAWRRRQQQQQGEEGQHLEEGPGAGQPATVLDADDSEAMAAADEGLMTPLGQGPGLPASGGGGAEGARGSRRLLLDDSDAMAAEGGEPDTAGTEVLAIGRPQGGSTAGQQQQAPPQPQARQSEEERVPLPGRKASPAELLWRSESEGSRRDTATSEALMAESGGWAASGGRVPPVAGGLRRGEAELADLSDDRLRALQEAAGEGQASGTRSGPEALAAEAPAPAAPAAASAAAAEGGVPAAGGLGRGGAEAREEETVVRLNAPRAVAWEEGAPAERRPPPTSEKGEEAVAEKARGGVGGQETGRVTQWPAGTGPGQVARELPESDVPAEEHVKGSEPLQGNQWPVQEQQQQQRQPQRQPQGEPQQQQFQEQLQEEQQPAAEAVPRDVLPQPQLQAQPQPQPQHGPAGAVRLRAAKGAKGTAMRISDATARAGQGFRWGGAIGGGAAGAASSKAEEVMAGAGRAARDAGQGARAAAEQAAAAAAGAPGRATEGAQAAVQGAGSAAAGAEAVAGEAAASVARAVSGGLQAAAQHLASAASQVASKAPQAAAAAARAAGGSASGVAGAAGSAAGAAGTKVVQVAAAGAEGLASAAGATAQASGWALAEAVKVLGHMAAGTGGFWSGLGGGVLLH
jgi:hypothetical protein